MPTDDKHSVEYLRVPYWPQDSIYTVLSRFALVNVCTNSIVEELFTGRGWRPDVKAIRGGLEIQSYVDNKAALAWLANSRESLNAMFLCSFPQGLGGPYSPYLRYCRICMGSQRHFVFFQRERQGQCPFHGFPLQDHCRACGMQISYTWGALLFVHPFSCPRCAAPLGIADGRVFYDVLTSRREALLRHYSRIGSESTYDGSSSEGSCPGFILTLSKSSWNGWHGLDHIPLRELRIEQVNWLLADGYVQLRTMNRGRKRTESQQIERRELLPCLKSLTRHLKKTWGIRRLAQRTSQGPCSTTEQTSAAQLVAYRNFCRFSASIIQLEKAEEAHASPLKGEGDWFFSKMGVAEVMHWPPSERVWYMRHRFMEYILDSLARCIESSMWSEDVSENFVNQFIEGAAKPLWPLEYIDEKGKTSYRIIRHRRFLDGSLT